MENRSFYDVKDLLTDFEVKSQISSSQSEILDGQCRKTKTMKMKLRNLLKNSDEREKIKALDNFSCNRSISLVNCLKS